MHALNRLIFITVSLNNNQPYVCYQSFIFLLDGLLCPSRCLFPLLLAIPKFTWSSVLNFWTGTPSIAVLMISSSNWLLREVRILVFCKFMHDNLLSQAAVQELSIIIISEGTSILLTSYLCKTSVWRNVRNKVQKQPLIVVLKKDYFRKRLTEFIVSINNAV